MVHKFIVSSSVLLDAVNIVKGAVPKGSSLPVMENICFDIKSSGECMLTATNLELSIRNKISVEAKESFACLIPAKKLIEILGTLEDQPLTSNYDNKKFTIEISTDYGKFDIATSDTEDFPVINAHEVKGEFQMSGADTLKVISKVGFAMGHDDLRPIMSGIYFDFSEGGGLKTVATDANRLSILNLPSTKSSAGSFVIPSGAIKVLEAIGQIEETLKFEYDATRMEVRAGKTIVNIRLVDGNYPNYSSVIPTNETFLSVKRTDLLKAVKQALLMTNQVTNQVKLTISKDLLVVNGYDLDFNNSANLRLSAEWNGENMEIGFNGKFLQEILSKTSEEKIKIGMSKPNRATVITEGEVLFLLMPVLLHE